MLELNGINKTFNAGTADEKILFSDFSFKLNDGDFVGVIGSNGSGKTTMLNIISGDIEPDSGKVILDGDDITPQKNFNRANRIGRVFQNPSKGTCPSMTIWENLSIADNKDNFISAGCVEQDMRHLILAGSISFILYQRTKIVKDSEIFLNDILLSRASIIRCQNMQLFSRFGYLKDELKQPNRRFAGRSRPF